MDKTEIETQLAARTARAAELRALRATTKADADALDLKVQSGEFATAGKAANKTAELAAIERALGVVVGEAREFEGQLVDIEAERLRELEIERVRGVAKNLKQAVDSRNQTLSDAAHALETAVTGALDDWETIYELQTQLDAARAANSSVFKDAVTPDLACRADRIPVINGPDFAHYGNQGVKIALNIAGEDRRLRNLSAISAEVRAKELAA